jgi:hypothetical protein
MLAVALEVILPLAALLFGASGIALLSSGISRGEWRTGRFGSLHWAVKLAILLAAISSTCIALCVIMYFWAVWRTFRELQP